jgi:H+/gluconate symporter-like permease
LAPAWAAWSAQTSYWPQPGGLAKITPLQWAIGTVLWLGATYGHIHANHVLAGIWRWLA